MRPNLPSLLLFLKRRAPTSLYGRSLLIIVLPILVMQILVTWLFFDAYWQRVNSHMTEGLAGEIAWVIQGYETDPTAAGLKHLSDRAEQSLDLSIIYEAKAQLPKVKHFALFGIDRAMDRALSDRIDLPYWFDTTRYPAYVDIRVKVPSGVLRIVAPRDRAFATQGYSFIFYLTVATVLLTALSVLFIRNQVRAIERLAAAADAFGKGADIPFKPYGAREVRQAGQSFLAMKNRIQRYVDQRTALLASVSHDLRTPLTRLKLELALAEPGARVEAMKRDLAEMEHMIDEYLAFARGEGGEALERVTLAPMLDEVSESAAQTGAEVRVDADKNLSATVRPNAMKRAISNLVMNAAAHGDHIEVAARPTPAGGVEILIDDDGPGIPPERFEEAFTPFGRLDEARNQNEKGVGLGLAIARDVARGHGGEVTLARSPLGGLRAVLRLPG
jgi:two-component system, OmpR family, osmolarity sensor histidine kinase EnvZ